MRFVCGDVRDLIVSYKKRPRPFVSALQSVAAVEAPKNQLLRDFRYRSILDFCNNICQQRTFTSAPAQARPFEGASISTSASVHPRRAGWGDVRIHLRVRSAGAAAAELQQLFRTVHGNQAAMDGFGEYRSDLPLREAQLILEEYLRPGRRTMSVSSTSWWKFSNAPIW